MSRTTSYKRKRNMSQYAPNKKPKYMPQNRTQPYRYRLVKPELKTLSTAVDQTVISTVNTNSNFQAVNLIRAGNGFYNRIGNKVCVKSLRVQGALSTLITKAATTESINGAVCRYGIVYDNQPNGVIPTFDTVFGTVAQDGSAATQFFDPIQPDRTKRFKVLMSRNRSMDPKIFNGGAGTVNGQYFTQYLDDYIKLKPTDKISYETQYNGDSSPMTIADISTGAFYFFAISSLNDASTVSSIDGSVTIRFEDV